MGIVDEVPIRREVPPGEEDLPSALHITPAPCEVLDSRHLGVPLVFLIHIKVIVAVRLEVRPLIASILCFDVLVDSMLSVKSSGTRLVKADTIEASES